MKSEPSFKVMAPFAAIYTLCLFLPTIDMLATYAVNLRFFSFPFGVAALIFPAIYPLSDSITEVYGKKVAYYVITVCYIAIVVMSLINNLLLSSADNHYLYDFLLKSSLLTTTVGPIAYILTSYINVKLISKLKMNLRGKHFVIRSVFCSSLSEAVTSLVVLPVVFYGQGSQYILNLYIGTVLMKVLVTLPFVFVARILVSIYRYVDDIYEPVYNTDIISSNQLGAEV